MEDSFKNKTPRELAEDIMQFAHLFSEYSDELGDILDEKSNKWSEIREAVTSDKQAEKLWSQTKKGKREIFLRLKMKSIEKQISAIKTYLSVKEKELRGQW